MVRASDVNAQIRNDVKAVELIWGDGTPFFDNLDARLTHPFYFEYLLNKILDDADAEGRNAPVRSIGSGKFGWAWAMYLHGRLPLNTVNFPGNLRHDPLVDPLIDPAFEGKEFVYVDNSAYKARTLIQINNYVKDWGGNIVKAYVLYDGSRPPHDWTKLGFPVDYLYRWHDGGFRI